MKRIGGMVLLLAVLGGCASADHSADMLGSGHFGPVAGPAMMPGGSGGFGQGGGLLFGRSQSEGAQAAHAVIAESQATAAGYNGSPNGIVQASAHGPMGGGIVQAGGMMPPPGMPGGMMPPGGMMGPGGMMPPGGMMGPGGMMPPGGVMAAGGMAPPMLPPPPGVMGAPGGPIAPGMPVPNAVAAAGSIQPGAPGCGPSHRTEVRFTSPAGLKVYWFGQGPDGRPAINQTPIDVPGRYNFAQGSIYRLKLSDIPNRPGVDLYPTLEIIPSTWKTDAFLAHSAVPIGFTDDDFDAVSAGNYLVKVIYLPFREYADVAISGPDEIVSTRLEPGADPIAEACRRGSLLAIIRVGNIDLEAPNTPAMDAPVGYAPTGMPGMLPPAMMPPPPGMAGPGGPAGPMVLPKVPQAVPVNNGPAGPVGPGPVSMSSSRSSVQPASFVSPSGAAPTPAQMAGQPRP